jgi:hypothetical protein
MGIIKPQRQISGGGSKFQRPRKFLTMARNSFSSSILKEATGSEWGYGFLPDFERILS